MNYGAKAGAWLWWCEGDRTGKSVNDMSMIGMMLRDSVWREVKWKWEVEAQEQSK